MLLQQTPPPPALAAAATDGSPLQLAIVNQVDYHLHVVAGAMRVLQPLTPVPVHVFVTTKVLQGHFGFMEWLGSEPGFVFRDCQELLGACSSSSTAGAACHQTAFDLVWHISPEFDLPFMQQVVPRLRCAHQQQQQHASGGAAAATPCTTTTSAVAATSSRPPASPPVQLFYVHNGHMPDCDLQQLCELAGAGAGAAAPPPLLGMSPHVAAYVQQRLDGQRQQQQQQQQQEAAGGAAAAPPAPAAAAINAEWMLPTWPYHQAPETGADSSSGGQEQEQQQQQQLPALDGFSITGSFDQSLRNYEKMWAAIAAHADAHGPGALRHFRLKLLGQVVAGELRVPPQLQQYVTVLAALPDAQFYAAISGSLAIVPALANPAYLTCKLTSAAITTLMTGVPILADAAFLAAYSFLGPDTVLQQRPGENELDAMFRVAAADPREAVWPVRARLRALAHAQNERGAQLLQGWLRAARHGDLS